MRPLGPGRIAPTLLAALTLLASAALPATAFSSFPPKTSGHDEVADLAFGDLGWPADFLDAVKQATRRPDFDESSIDSSPEPQVDAAPAYEPAHHCDRLPPATDAQAVQATLAFVATQRTSVHQFAEAGLSGPAVRALGSALHALEDCFSHSDLAEQGPSAAAALQEAFVHGAAPPPMRVTAFDPGAEKPEFPPDDPYPHGDHAKDAAGHSPSADLVGPDGRTRLQAAMAFAAAAARAFTLDVMDGLSPEARATLMSATDDDVESGRDAPMAPMLAALVIVLAAAGRARGRRPGDQNA